MLLLHVAMLTAPLALFAVHRLWPLPSLGVCAFRAIFGVDCPACGVTHSAAALFTGHLQSAFRYHPAGPVIVGIIALTTVYLLAVVFTKVNGLAWRDEVRASRRMEWVAVASLLMGWIGKSLIH
jgi:hypothetical protein